MRNPFITLANYMLRGNFPVSLRFEKDCGLIGQQLLGCDRWKSRNTRAHVSQKDLWDLAIHSMIFLMMIERCGHTSPIWRSMFHKNENHRRNIFVC